MVVVGPILLVVDEVGSSPADKTIRIGYLASYVQAGGAIDVAIEHAQNDGLLLGYNFRYRDFIYELLLRFFRVGVMDQDVQKFKS